MAITANIYVNLYAGQFSATAARRIDYVTDTINAGLTTSTYTPSQTGHTFYSDITNEVASAAGYTTKGVALGTKSISVSTNDTRLIAASSVWTSSGTFTANKAFVFKDTGTASTSPLMSYVQFGGDNTAASGATFTLAWDATNGVLKTTPA